MHPTLSKALRLAAHPLSISAVGLLAMNDAVLKQAWPAAWTGKMSDLAVLFFLPLVLGAGFALAIPDLIKRKARIVPGLAFGLPLLTFTLLKLTPETNLWLVGAVRSLTGFTVRAVADPTDLLALGSLAAAGWVWRRTPARSPAHPGFRPGLLILPVAVLVTLADAAAPNYGINQLCIQGQGILARGYYAAYGSTDGGLTWSETADSPMAPCPQPGEEGEITLVDPASETRYRVSPGVGVERSADGGQTWAADPLPASHGEAEETYQRKTRGGTLMYQPGPLDAVLAPGTGNLVLAMGHDGVLVRAVGNRNPTGGEWTWAAVGPFAHASLARAGINGYLGLLSLEIALAVTACLFWLALGLRPAGRPGWRTVLFAAGWLLLGLAVLALFPDISAGSYTAVISIGMLVAAGLWAVGLLLAGILRGRRPGLVLLLHRALFIPLILIFILLPYVLWALNILPTYGIAAVVAAGFFGLASFLGREYHLAEPA